MEMPSCAIRGPLENPEGQLVPLTKDADISLKLINDTAAQIIQGQAGVEAQWYDENNPFAEDKPPYLRNARLCLMEEAGKRIDAYYKAYRWARTASLTKHVAIWIFGLAAGFKFLEVALKKRGLHLTREGRISSLALLVIIGIGIAYRKIHSETDLERLERMQGVVAKELAEPMLNCEHKDAVDGELPSLPTGLDRVSRFIPLDLPEQAISRSACHGDRHMDGKELPSGHYVDQAKLNVWIEAIYQGFELSELPSKWDCENPWHGAANGEHNPYSDIFAIAGQRFMQASDNYARDALKSWAWQSLGWGSVAAVLATAASQRLLGIRRSYAVGLGAVAALGISRSCATARQGQGDVVRSFATQKPSEAAADRLRTLDVEQVQERALELQKLRPSLSSATCLGFAIWWTQQKAQDPELVINQYFPKASPVAIDEAL